MNINESASSNTINPHLTGTTSLMNAAGKRLQPFTLQKSATLTEIFCNLKGAIARENALLLLKPFKVVDECCEFE